MSRETRTSVGNLSVRGGRLYVDGQQLRFSLEPEKIQQLNRWWDRDVAPIFRGKAQVWMNNQGAIIATSAGMNVEGVSHELEEDAVTGKLIAALSSSNGYHFEVEDVLERAKRDARLMEYSMGKTGWANGFLLDFLGDLSTARNLSEKRKAELKRAIVQDKLQLSAI